MFLIFSLTLFPILIILTPPLAHPIIHLNYLTIKLPKTVQFHFYQLTFLYFIIYFWQHKLEVYLLVTGVRRGKRGLGQWELA